MKVINDTNGAVIGAENKEMHFFYKLNFETEWIKNIVSILL